MTGKKSFFERTGQTSPRYMVERGKDLAESNRNCEGTSNKAGGFYKCASKDQVHKRKANK